MASFKYLLWVSFMIMLISTVSAAPGATFTDPCYAEEHLAVAIYFGGGNITDTGLTGQMQVENTCTGTKLNFQDDLNLTTFGEIQDGEIVIADDFVYVDAVMRPDLDVPAIITFTTDSYLFQPNVLLDGYDCGGSCNETYNSLTDELFVEVGGFSNYSLTARQDFTLHSDFEPELREKVYQTVDLGDSNRATDFKCIVEIFAQNEASQYILVQTNPERAVQARILGNPDTNQPESLGYFPADHGMANVYFRGDEVAAYADFIYVATCSSNSTQLIYEESISTRHSPLGRKTFGRLIWLTDMSGRNAFFLSVYVVGLLFLLWMARMIYVRTIRGSR